MKITTRISSNQCAGADHHPECGREHTPIQIQFISASPEGGFGRTKAMDCMLYEMEDAAYDSIVEAYGRGDYDDDAVREVAADVASRADGLLTGGKAHVRSTVAAA